MASSPQADRTILVTGATDGLGRGCAAELAASGATLLLHGRDEGRGAALMEELHSVTGNERLHWYCADLASLEQVGRLAAAIRADHERLDVLVSNAGIGARLPGGGERQVSEDGHELRFAVNYLAGFALIRLLLGLLRARRHQRGSSASARPVSRRWTSTT